MKKFYCDKCEGEVDWPVPEGEAKEFYFKTDKNVPFRLDVRPKVWDAHFGYMDADLCDKCFREVIDKAQMQ